MQKLKISVCIATYNGEKFIKEQLDSILRQCDSNDEIIISDDGSTDKTLDIIKSYNDDRIKIYINSKVKGYTNNFENALSKAKGEYIFLSDQDDIWVDKKIEITLKYLQKADFVISDCTIVDSNLKIIKNSYFELRGKRNSLLGILYKTDYLGCCIAFNKKILELALPFPENKKLCPHDLWLGLVAYSFFSVIKIDDKLILYRRHNENTSNILKSKESLKFKIKYRLYALINIFSLKIKGKKCH